VDYNEQVYVRLQRHLNKQPVGFPATRSGAEIRILKHIFAPREAEIASYLSYRLEPLETVFKRVRHLVASPQELAELLDRIQKKGGIESKAKDGKMQYANAPLVVGMYEMQLKRLTPEFVKDFNEYTSQKKFGIEFLGTEVPQMRTIPIAKSIRPEHKISTFDEVTALLQQAEAPFVILECICRKKRAMEGRLCKITDRKETCLALGSIAQAVLLSGNGREVARDEAMSILSQNQKQGLVLQPSNTQKADFICSCCGCCCGMLEVHKKLPKPLDFWASNFNAVVQKDACDGCGLCEKRCQVRAVSVSEKKQTAEVDLNRCLGCGVCVSACPNEAIFLLRKQTEMRPPPTREELYELIMSKKKGRWGKLKLAGKLIIDTIRSA
jgi:Pyruvate/2-oxoacid:ferredoxin oxidoreductase delta subunit